MARSTSIPSGSSSTLPCSCRKRTHAPRRVADSSATHRRTTIMVNLAGKTALVTGASRGIGRASALALAQGGAQVLAHYGRGKAEAEAVVAEIRKCGGRAEVVTPDLAAPDGAPHLARQV